MAPHADRTADTPQTTPARPEGDMVWIPGGTFRMGSDKHYPEERPVHTRHRRRVLDGPPSGDQRASSRGSSRRPAT